MAKEEKVNEKELPKGIRLKTDGRYEGRFRYAGQDYYVVDKSLTKCKKMLADLRYEVEHGIFAKQENITVNSWFNTWIEMYKAPNVKKGTIVVYNDHYKYYIQEVLGKLKLKDIRAEHIQKLYNDMHKSEYSQNTIEVTATVLSGMFKQAMKNRIIKDNPVAYATLPRNHVLVERRVMSLEEQKIFLEYAKDNYLYDLIEIALSTGMRSGELRGLCWSDVDFNNKTLHIRHSLNYYGNSHVLGLPKTKTSIRDIPMLENVQRILKNIKKKQSEARMKLGDNWKEKEGLENLVFTTGCGGPLNRALLAKQMNRILKEIQNDKPEFKHISPHTFRHTFATRCIEAGMQPQVLKTILGHSKLSQTMDLYAHVLQDTKAEEMKRIANLF